MSEVPRLRAEIHGPEEIRFTVMGAALPTDPACYRLLDGGGSELEIASIEATGEGSARLRPVRPLDPYRVHRLEHLDDALQALVRRDPLFRTLSSTKPLGAQVVDESDETWFRVFAPRATAVRLHLYQGRGDAPDAAVEVVEMRRDDDGVWEASRPGDLHGIWYDFTVHGPEDPGNFFYETHPVHVSDPYALVNDDALGRSRVWRDGPPPPPVVGGRPAMEAVIAYEVHVQDFTDLLPVDDHELGTLPAMVRGGLTNREGEPIGFDHLVDLGVNVVHLMPVQEFLHYPDEDWRDVFGGDPFARAMAIENENYQWGYRTTHAFAVESRFRSRDAEPGAERDQLRALIRAFHERGIAVIIDIVPNHTGENMDDRELLLNFNVLDRAYYFRLDDELRHIGPFGNEIKSEERPMVQRWIIDQMRHWVDALGVDGFRIDLAGQIDKQTLSSARRELPDDLIIYGEPWIAPSDPDVRANPEWSWYKADAPITFFQDDARNAFVGSPFDIGERGWAGGDGTRREAAMAALANDYAEEPRSTNGISYLDIHDNWALADRFALKDFNGLEGVDLDAVGVAAALLFTSAGPIVLQGGTEMLRSKGSAPMREREVDFQGAPIRFKGRGDTYNLRAPNRFLWESLVPGSDVAAMRDYWKGLIALRMSHPGRVFRTADVPDGHYRWILPEPTELLGYEVGARVLVLANSGDDAGRFSFELASDGWRQVGRRMHVALEGIGGPHASLAAGAHEIEVAAGSVLIWVRD